MMTVTWNHLQKKSRGGLCWGCQVSLPAARIKGHKGRTLAESGDEPTGPWGFSDSIQGCSLLPLLICTAAPPMGRQTLLLLAPLYCERPGAIWHHAAVRWAVIQPGLADCQWRGLPLLMQIVGGGGLFHFPFLFLRQSHRWICFEPVCHAFMFHVFRAADWSNCSLTT